MNNNESVVPHPYRLLMVEALREREVADSGEGQALEKAVFQAVDAYSQFLDRHGLIWEFGANEDIHRMKAQALVVTLNYGSNEIEIAIKDGALDRVYGTGSNPDPNGLGPSDIPHKPRGEHSDDVIE